MFFIIRPENRIAAGNFEPQRKPEIPVDIRTRRNCLSAPIFSINAFCANEFARREKFSVYFYGIRLSQNDFCQRSAFRTNDQKFIAKFVNFDSFIEKSFIFDGNFAHCSSVRHAACPRILSPSFKLEAVGFQPRSSLAFKSSSAVG